MGGVAVDCVVSREIRGWRRGRTVYDHPGCRVGGEDFEGLGLGVVGGSSQGWGIWGSGVKGRAMVVVYLQWEDVPGVEGLIVASI